MLWYTVGFRHITRAEDWQQGLGVVTIHEGDDWEYETGRIHAGRCYFRGKVYEP